MLPDVFGPARALFALPGETLGLVRDTRRVVRRIDVLLDGLATTLERVPDTQAQVAQIAQTTGRIMGLIDDVGTRMSSFPGAPLLAARRRPKTD
jgi:hypothetical protein